MKQEKIKYTKEEKELLELCAYIKSYNEVLLIFITEDRDFFNERIKETDFFVVKVNEVAEHRRSTKKITSEREQKKWDTFRDIDCPKCDRITNQKPKGEMRNDKNWRVFLFYCPYCEKTHGDWFPIEEKDQLKWMDNFIEQSLLVKEDGTTIAEKLNMTKESLEESKISRNVTAKYVKEIEVWDGINDKFYADTAIYINQIIQKLKVEKKFIESIKAKTN